MIRPFLVAGLIGFSAIPAQAALHSKTLAYNFSGKTFQGYLAWDDSFAGPRPGVLVVHEFWGLNEYAKSRADQLAKLGYIAFAADMFGDGKVATHPDDAKAMAKEASANLSDWVGRSQSALDTLKSQPRVDPQKLAAIGYCFGGATALQLAFSGADLKLTASFHGSLPVPESAAKVRGKIFVFHGADDTFISPETIRSFQAKLDESKVDYRFVSYPGAVHGFTVPGSEKRGVPGVAYHQKADQESWRELLAGLETAFKSAAPSGR